MAAVCAAATVLALLPPPRDLRSSGEPGATVPGEPGPVIAWLRGREDAVPLGRRLGLGAVLAGVAALLAVRVGAPVWLSVGLAPVLLVAAVVLLGRVEPSSTRRRRQTLVLQTPQALELMASCLAAGLPVRSACAVVCDAFDGPVAEDLGRVRAATDLGVADAEAWQALAGHPQLGPAAADLARSVESGTLLVSTLRHHATQARERRQAALQVVARSVGVRSVMPLMTCFIPAFLLLGVVPTVASALARALSL
ncbi:type II secretion system F family protein [Microlunatus flavus]|uniref:type II secretion system F family protein n=1 Tax=Microlunatus flavus TaxID=1036181 RepID=UPI001113BBA8|nr:type II secretion system F family protein [Microlunatus flavus]